MSLAILFHFLCAQHVSDINISRLACNTDTTPTQPHRNSNTHRNKNNTTNVVIQQHIRKLLMLDILMPVTCWEHKKWNKIASDIQLVFYSSTITMMHDPINIRIVYDIGILLWQHVSVCLRPSSGKPTQVKGTIGAYYVIWDPILFAGCTQKQLIIYTFLKVNCKIKFPIPATSLIFNRHQE